MGSSYSTLALTALAPAAGGAYLGYLTRADAQSEWYKSLEKPKCAPPAKVEAPVWTGLYLTGGVAAWRVAKTGKAGCALGLYASYVALAYAWMPLFFKRRNLKLSAAEAVAVSLAALGATVAFFKKDRVAGALLVPTALYTAHSTAMAIVIAKKNDPAVARAFADLVAGVKGALAQAGKAAGNAKATVLKALPACSCKKGCSKAPKKETAEDEAPKGEVELVQEKKDE